MALELSDCSFFGPALPEPFVKLDLEKQLVRNKLLAKAKELEAAWEPLQRRLRALGQEAGALRVANHVLEPLVGPLGFERLVREEKVETREGEEDGGFVMQTSSGASLRCWAVDANTNLDAPTRRGHAYRFSPTRVSERVLLARGERAGLLTDGEELRLLLCDPARAGSHVSIRLDRSSGWRGRRSVPDSYRLLRALVSPAGLPQLPALLDAARLGQTEVTKTLRQQARTAVEEFVQQVLRHPANADWLAGQTDRDAMAATLWHEGLLVAYRLLFIFKLEASPDPARVFTFNSSSLWRNTYSPSMALAPWARRALEGAETGQLLESGLRRLFQMFDEGLSCSELVVSPLGGVLFSRKNTSTLEALTWGERAVACLLDRLLWTSGEGEERMRVHYGPLDVEDLGRVYEALLELEPGYATEPMARLGRDKLEVVVPAAQAVRYRASTDGSVAFLGEVPADTFFLRVGLGRKATGSYYTPHAFVRFLVQATLDPLVAERSPRGDPQPLALLSLRVIDPAMGSGHFLVEACRYLGEKLYEACRLCDELASREEEKAQGSKSPQVRDAATKRAEALRRRVQELPDPNDELLAYLPSRILEGEEAGLSQARALALCRRLVAVHCLYGVDKNPLAVELAKVTLWLESFAEGLPLTFMDHRLVCGDSVMGPFSADLLREPGTGNPLEGLFAEGLDARVKTAADQAMAAVKELEASIGISVADIERKHAAHERLRVALEPWRKLAVHWTQAAARGAGTVNGRAWEEVLQAGEGGAIDSGFGADVVAFDLAFPEVFFGERRGFDVVLGNPPWDAVQPLAKEFFAAFDLEVLDAPTRLEREAVEERLLAQPAIRARWERYNADFEHTKRVSDALFHFVGREADLRPSGAVLDLWQLFAERARALLREGGRLGMVLPSAFHANQSATGIRHLYLEESSIEACFSFENARKLFEIHASFKFATVVVQRHQAGTSEFRCAFYLHEPEWLFTERQEGLLRFSRDFVRRTGGKYLSFVELRGEADFEVARAVTRRGELFGVWSAERAIRVGPELDMAKSAKEFFTDAAKVLKGDEDPREAAVASALRARGYLPLHEGKTFHQYTDRWDDRPRYLVALDALGEKLTWRRAAQFYRLAFRDIARSTDERTGIFCLLPPGVLCGNTAPCERNPAVRTNADALLALSLANSHTFDWNLRQKSAAHVNLFILNGVPVPKSIDGELERFLVHGALRLSCNAASYEVLWREQLPGVKVPGWPVVPSDGDERWVLRSRLDAAIAHAYGLNRPQYEHVLAGFSHSSFPAAKDLCLGSFDELTSLGLSRFVRDHDPHHAVALVRSLPEPVLKLVDETEGDEPQKPKRAAGRKKKSVSA
jgi:hypothetical protein